MRFAAAFTFCFLASSVLAAPTNVTVGKIRVQVLSPHLIRIEERGPKGFEERNTFHVVNRSWPGAKVTRSDSRTYAIIKGPGWRVSVKLYDQGLKNVLVNDDREAPLWRFDGKLVNSAWLPAPGDRPKAWSFADTPRIVPSPYGLTPAPNADLNSGWDLSNDAADVYVFLPVGSYSQLRADFLKLTGPVPLPPLYTLGFVDSRYYAYREKEALARIDEYHRRAIPLDMFVVDTDWRIGASHGYASDPKYFPDMPRFLRAAKAKEVRIMFNDHPEPQAKTALDPKELNYRFEGLAGLLRDGVDVWWYDRNWNVGLVPPMPHLARETWGMKLYHDITARVRPRQRPLIMANVDGIDNGSRNRPPNVAAHRYPVQWTGDTRADWRFLRLGVENAVFEGVQALNPWVNEDLGGHVGRPSDELYVRFLQFGAVSPMMRIHCTKGQTREPWAFSPKAERIAVDYIRLRYRLMPLLYSLAREATDTGVPMLRRCDLHYPQFKEARRDDQFILGDSLLVAPIVDGDDFEVVPASAFTDGLKGEYFASREPVGTPVLTRQDNAVNFDWGSGSPAPGLPNDYFSARWTGRVTIPAGGTRILAVTGDDGVRFWIDGKLLVDKWVPQDNVTTEAQLDLRPGSTHDIKLDYMEQQFGAVAKLKWRTMTADTGSRRQVWVPPGDWTDVWTGTTFTGPRTFNVSATLSQMPMYIRAGGLIPTVQVAKNTNKIDWSTMEIDAVPGNGQFSVYEDDGISTNYDRYRRTPIKMELKGRRCRIEIGASKSVRFPAAPRRSWTLHLPAAVSDVRVDGRRVEARLGGGVLLRIGTRSVVIPTNASGKHVVTFRSA